MNQTVSRVNTYVISAAVLGYIAFKLYQFLFRGRRSPLAGKCDEVTTVVTAQQWEELYPAVKADLDEFRVLGFDCEWVTRANQPCPVSLVQLATHRGQCVLIRMKIMSQSGIPKSLITILEDKRILKVGVGCIEDGRRLFRDYQINVQGCVDLRNIAMRTRQFGLGKTNLEGLARELVGVKLDKSSRIRCSNWEEPRLTDEQVVYAANDALVAMDILLALLDRKFGAEDGRTVITIDNYMADKCAAICQGIIDNKFKSSTNGRQTNPNNLVS